jgi:DNA-binding protein HU-beta
MPPAKKPAAAVAKKPAAPTTAAFEKPAPAAKTAATLAAKNGTSAKKVTATPQATITIKQLAAELAEGHGVAKKQAESMLGDFVALATQHLKKGDKVRLTGLGILAVRARPARTGRNPATGASIEIAASRKIAFRPAKELREAV